MGMSNCELSESSQFQGEDEDEDGGPVGKCVRWEEEDWCKLRYAGTT
jgi:hypothetical protein